MTVCDAVMFFSLAVMFFSVPVMFVVSALFIFSGVVRFVLCKIIFFFGYNQILFWGNCLFFGWVVVLVGFCVVFGCGGNDESRLLNRLVGGTTNGLALGAVADFGAQNCLPALHLIRSTNVYLRTSPPIS
ncbi:MAG: hypothetical protein JST20_03900 [Bacteroidetes bacterium]|nr:hypothetical protein [Bacteroidota bacterium]